MRCASLNRRATTLVGMVEIRVLHPSDAPRVVAFLGRFRESSMFLLSNIARSGIVDGSKAYQGAYVGAFDADEMVAVGAHYWNGNVMLQMGDHVELAGELTRAAVAVSGRGIKGVVGELRGSEAAVQSLGFARSQFQLHEKEGLYGLSLAEMRAPQLASKVRRAQMADYETLLNFYTAYNIEALNEPDARLAREDAARSLDGRYEDARRFVLDLDGEIVAASAFNAVSPPLVQIGGVWTPHPLRARGYARACVAGSLAIASREGADAAILFTGDENTPAIRSYTSIGFRQIGGYFIGLLRDAVRLPAKH